ncbi:hypothetical protein CBOM_07311 [Ceraceosorus bombacis]|uniref:Uncharacterized protein n=1 Tax=Ceraceosorus bombacis TaxID=401625 RepID=A0A0P1B8A3_9BASI|nr:hypothetical protein CBOM_07311 [Ceraceosorus bombacis]
MPLMMVRTWAICNKNRFVGVLLAVSWLVSLALSLYAAQFYIGTPFANIPGLGPIGGCTNAIANFWPTSMFIAWGTVDVICFVLAGGQILLLWRRTGFRSSLQQALFREGLQYFITVMSINVINIAFTVTNTLPPFIRPAMAQPAAVATLVGTSRLYMALLNFGNQGYAAGSTSSRDQVQAKANHAAAKEGLLAPAAIQFEVEGWTRQAAADLESRSHRIRNFSHTVPAASPPPTPIVHLTRMPRPAFPRGGSVDTQSTRFEHSTPTLKGSQNADYYGWIREDSSEKSAPR